MSRQLEAWLQQQAEIIRAFAVRAEADGCEFQAITILFARPPGVPDHAPVYQQRVCTTRDPDALIESAMASVTVRHLDADYQHRVIRDQEL